MNNERSLFPPLFRKVDTGGGSEIREKIAEIDSEITDINSDITNIDSAITRLSNNVGNLSNLDTTDKSSLVGAVNEVASAGGGYAISTTETDTGIIFNGKTVYCKLIPNASLPAQFSIGANSVKLTTDATIETIVDSAFIVRYSTYFKLVIRGNVFVTTTYGEVEWSGQGGYNISSGDIDEKELVIWYTKKS